MPRVLQGRHVRVRHLVGMALDGVYIAGQCGGDRPLFQDGPALRLGRNAGSIQERVHEPLSEIIVAHAGIYSGFRILDTLRPGVPLGIPDESSYRHSLRGRMRRIHYVMCALLALFWAAPLAAQQPTGTIRGRITDNSTQQPIAGVTIVVGNRNTVTRPDGRFTISGVAVGSDLLRARVIGYAQANQPVMIAGGDTV